jgi:hypothetical protein
MFHIIIIVSLITLGLVLLLIMYKYMFNVKPDQFQQNKEIYSKVYTKRLFIEF